MNIAVILLIAIGLAADCFAVSLGISSCQKMGSRQIVRLALSFGVFQTFMPVLGWLIGRTIESYISTYDHWIAFALLAIIGGNMVWESLHNKEQQSAITDVNRILTVILLSVATSIDALGVGLSFSVLQINIVTASVIIGLVAFSITIAGSLIGGRVGTLTGKRAKMVGGVILIVIGIRIVVDHIF